MEFAANNDFKEIIVVGNAPTIIYKAIELYKSELAIDSIVDAPVGFAGASDSKQALKIH